MKSVAELENGQGGSAGKLIPQGGKPTAADYRKLAIMFRQAATGCDQMAMLSDAGCDGRNTLQLLQKTHDILEDKYQSTMLCVK